MRTLAGTQTKPASTIPTLSSGHHDNSNHNNINRWTCCSSNIARTRLTGCDNPTATATSSPKPIALLYTESTASTCAQARADAARRRARIARRGREDGRASIRGVDGDAAVGVASPGTAYAVARKDRSARRNVRLAARISARTGGCVAVSGWDYGNGEVWVGYR